MKLAAPAVLAVALVALAGCMPTSSSAAHQKCVDYLVATYEEVTPDATADDVAEVTAASENGCTKDEAEDPSAFAKQWG